MDTVHSFYLQFNIEGLQTLLKTLHLIHVQYILLSEH